MRLESALNASRQGLTTQGQAIAVIGDNVSNSNTTGYKASRIEFSDLLGSGDENTHLYGSGYGVQVQSVRAVHESGIIEATGRQLDVGIAGDGFFLVGDAAAPKYTRAGNFITNPDGTLATADGLPVLGLVGESTTLSEINLSTVNVTGQPSTAMTMTGNLNAQEINKTAAPAAPATFNELNAAATYLSNVTAYDSLGSPHNVSVAFTKTANNTWIAQAFMDGGDVGQTAGTPVQIGQNVTLNFDTSGEIPDASAAASVLTCTPAYGNGAAAGSFTIDLSSFSQLGTVSQVSSISQDGKGVGNISGYEIDIDGSIYAQLDSGSRVLLGQLQLAKFVNVDGLERAGSNLYVEGDNVGDRSISDPNVGGFGGIEDGSLERSTVDIANEFVNMVIYERAYQANSKTLNTVNGMLRDTLSLLG